jgi:wobble nucleotide-excising tRNase
VLRKFLSIQNVGRFRSMVATGDVELREFNLVFGENGRGKTTLCAILRSVQSGEPSHIRGRHTLGSSLPSGVQIMTTGQSGPVQYRDGAWSSILQEVVIYDQTFVSQNVYVGDTVGADQKRNLFKVIVGQAAVRSAEDLDVIVRDIRTVSTAIREGQTAVRSHLPTGMKLETFLNASPDTEIETKIAAASADVRAASEVDLLRTRSALHRLELPVAPVGMRSLLGESLDSLSAGAEQLIRIHLDRHGMRGEKLGQAWLAEGMNYRVEEGCPFCGQPVDGLDLLGAYRTLFSADYRDLKDRITEVGRQVGSQFGEPAAAAVTQAVRDNLASHDFWSRFAGLPPLDQAQVEAAGSMLRTYGQGLLEILRRKVASPLEPLALSEELMAASADYARMHAAAARYNAQCDAANVVINARRATADGAALPRLQSRLLELQALKKRRERPVLELCSDLLGKMARKEELETKRERLKQDLDAQSQRVSAYRDAINRYLDLFNAGFEVAKVDHNYVGGVNASFQISINKVAVAAGDDKTSADQPSFRNTLSAGDRSTLALAFFLAQLAWWCLTIRSTARTASAATKPRWRLRGSSSAARRSWCCPTTPGS